MTLRIVRGTEPISVDTLTTLVYGDPGSGKTSLAFTAASPLLLDFDRGAHRSGFRGDSVPIDRWGEVDGMGAADLAPYATIVVDTVGRCVDAMAIEIMRETPKMRSSAGQLTLQGWGVLKARFAAWMRELRSHGKDVVLIAHGVESRSGDDLILRPDIAGGSYGEVFKLADGVAHLNMRGNRRILSWDPTDGAVGKNPAGLTPSEIPHLAEAPTYLADLIASIKHTIGAVSEASRRVQEQVSEWAEKIEKAGTAKALTAILAAAGEELQGAALSQAKALIARRMKALGLRWDGEKFTRKAEAEADAGATEPEPVEATA